jgi:hypothetical protein
MHFTAAMEIVGGRKAAERFFGVSPAALSQWKDKGRIPELRALQLVLLFPNIPKRIKRPKAKRKQIRCRKSHLRKLK